MKKIRFIAAIMAALLFASPLFAAKKGDKSKGKTTSTTTLNRGSGLRITVPAPNARGLTTDDEWATQVIQDLMTTGFSTYTSMTVIDRSNEQLVIEEQKRSERGTYSDTDYLEMGKITQAQYLLVGSITNAGGVYRLALSVNDGTTNEIKASFNESVTLNDIQNGNATNKALLTLIPSLGFELTSDEINKLNKKSATAKSSDERTVSTVNLAKGMSAEHNKNTVEALAYYASSNTKEAALRYDNISLAVSTGNIREDVKNDIAARNEWIKIYQDLQKYVYNNAITITYDIRPGEYETNYRTNTVTIPYIFSYDVNPTMLDVYRQIERGLNATGKRSKWETGSDFEIKAPYYKIRFQLNNESGIEIGTVDANIDTSRISDALYEVKRSIDKEQETQTKTTRGFTRERGYNSSNSRDNNVYKIEFSDIPYTNITDSLSMGITYIAVRASSWDRKNITINPPIDITVLGQQEARNASAGTMRTITAGEPAKWGDYKKGDRGPAGGFVVKAEKKGWIIDGKEYHYLEVSPYVINMNSDITKTLLTLISYSGHTVKKIGSQKIKQDLGAGLVNTNMLLEAAAEVNAKSLVSLIADYYYGGFNDWYIPTDDEIDAVGYWLDWAWSSSEISGRGGLAYLFTWEGAISLRNSAYQESAYTTFNIADFKGYWDPPKSDCILFVRSF